MRPSCRWVAAVAILVVAAAGAAAQVQGPSRDSVKRFMRQKLALTQAALEGLAVEDYGKIAEAATALRALSEDAQWRVTPNVNYLRLSNEFQAQADEMAVEARARDIDGATLAYVHMTLTCVKCHKLLRQEKLLSSLPEGGER